jgi:mono/diheme cytochrome c family protein
MIESVPREPQPMRLTGRPGWSRLPRAMWVCVVVSGVASSLAVPAEPDSPDGFQLSEQTQDLIPEVRPAVVRFLKEKFGDPSSPVTDKEFSIDASAVAGRAVYKANCLRCHGTGGDGRGPEADKLDPRPRDFRLGVFKWKSTRRPIKPTRHDLRETIRLGIPQTAMPAFDKLAGQDVDAVTEYVRWLSMAGTLDHRLGREISAEGFSTKEVAEQLRLGEQRRVIVAKANQFLKDDFPGIAKDVSDSISKEWKEAEFEKNVVRPKKAPAPLSDESVMRGRNLFVAERRQCHLCHGPDGKGDGEKTRSFWPIPNSQPPRKYAKPGLHDDWGNPQTPGDLNQGVFRGGDAPDDLYRRIVEGIPGTMMPGYTNVLSDEEAWDVINFLQSLRPDKLRGKAAVPRRPTPPGT